MSRRGPVDPRLLRASGAARAHLGVAVVLGLATALLVLLQATLLARIVARVFMDGASLVDVRGEVVWLVVAVAARAAVSFGFEASGHLGASRVMRELRGRLVDHVLRTRRGGLDGMRSGELAATAVQGVDALDPYFSRYLPQLALAALVPAAVLAWVIPVDWKSALVMAATLPAIPVFMVLIGKTTERRTRARWRALSLLGAHFLDVVRGLPTLKAHGRAGAQADSIRAVADAYRRETIGVLRIAFLSAFVLELAAMLGTALVAVTIGVRLANGGLGLEAGLTVLLLAPELYLPLRQVGAQFHASADGLAAAERIFEVLDEAPTAAPAARPAPVPDLRRAPVRFERVDYAYAERPGLALDGIDFELDPGERVALVGPNGGGKSTVLRLLLRLADPTGGRVRVGGIDLRELDPARWREQIAWVPQRPHLFTGTVEENIRLGDRSAGRERVRAAAAAANALDFVEALPDGFATVVGAGGRRLSAGETQRLALARTFLRDAPLLLLDEPTANLDAESEAAIADALERLVLGRTALLVVHRPALAAGADRIVTLAGGRVVDIASRGAAVPAEAAA